MKIKNKFKFIRSTIILILIILGIFCVSVSKEKTEYIDYTVGKGETLWSIAADRTDGDIRDYIYTIKDINGMTTSELQEGQAIKLLKEVKQVDGTFYITCNYRHFNSLHSYKRNNSARTDNRNNFSLISKIKEVITSDQTR